MYTMQEVKRPCELTCARLQDITCLTSHYLMLLKVRPHTLGKTGPQMKVIESMLPVATYPARECSWARAGSADGSAGPPLTQQLGSVFQLVVFWHYIQPEGPVAADDVVDK